MTARRVKPWNRAFRSNLLANNRKQAKRYLIITEGNTEEIYFSHFKTSMPLQIILENPAVTKQLNLVNRAISLRNDQAKNKDFITGHDEVWVVFDRDAEPTNPNDLKNFRAAISLAKKEGVYIALSNDSFELWYLMHFQRVSTAMHRSDLVKKLSKHLGHKYSKTEDLYQSIKVLRVMATKHAKNLHDRCIADDRSWEDENPLTLVYILVDKIRNEKGFREID